MHKLQTELFLFRQNDVVGNLLKFLPQVAFVCFACTTFLLLERLTNGM